jgi:hypothetical protein
MPGPDTGEALIKAHVYDTDIGANLAVVKGVADNSVALPAAANAELRGFTLNAGKAGERHPIIMDCGIPYATAAAAFASGVDLAIADTAGRLRLAAAGERVCAKSMEAATAAGDIVPVEIKRSVGV